MYSDMLDQDDRGLHCCCNSMQVQSHAYSKHTVKIAGPYLQKLKIQILKTYHTAFKSISNFLERNRTVSHNMTKKENTTF